MAIADDIKTLVEKLPVHEPRQKKLIGPAKGDAPDQEKYVIQPWTEVGPVLDDILATGEDGVTALIDLVNEVDDGSDVQARYALHALSLYTAKEGKTDQRAPVMAAVTKAVGSDRPKPIREHLIHELRRFGDKQAVPTLAAQLGDDKLCDAAVLALVAIKDGGPEALEKAVGGATGRRKLSMVHGIAALGDKGSAKVLAKAAGDADPGVQMMAAWGLAKLGTAKSADAVFGAVAAQTTRMDQIRAIDNCYVLAEALEGAGDNGAAARVRQRIEAVKPIEVKLPPKVQPPQ
jgi:HEAT repeat protein